MAEIDITLCVPGASLEAYREDIWNIVQDADLEFIPSLSSRESTTTRSLDTPSAWRGPVVYFANLMKQHAFVASVNGKVVALSSFIPHYQDEQLAPFNPSTYVTTTIVKLMYRRQGAGLALNNAIENLSEDLASPFITRRTWSTNESNVGLLTSLGFQEINRLPNHRGANVDTVYFGRTTQR